MKQADLNEVAGILKASFDPIFGVSSLEKNKAFVRHLWKTRLPGCCFVAIHKKSSNIAGYAFTGKCDNWWEKKSADIKSLAVCGDYRRSGVGSQLIGLAARAARNKGFSHTVLDVMVSNDKAIAFYDTLGFRVEKHLMKRRT